MWFLVWSLRLLLLSSALALPLAQVANAADPGLATRSDVYLHRPNGALADPINLIFRNAGPDGAAIAMQRVMGWKPASGSQLDFLHPGQPSLATWQIADDLGHGSRYHMRIDRGSNEDGQPIVFAAVHRDDLTACGHIGHDFNNAARDMVAAAFAAAGYGVTEVSLHNVAPGRQCDGSMSAGDGDAAVIDLGE